MLQREFQFSEQDFVQIQRLIYEHCGIELSDKKRDMVYSRLARRVRRLKLNNVASYLERVKSDTEEATQFVNALTTNLTSFFRESHHFTEMSQSILPSLFERNSEYRKLRIWSAGCSSGEEPYSIAITLLPFVKQYATWDIKILATDLDTNILATAKQGVYSEERLEKVESSIIKRAFKKGRADGVYQVNQTVKQLISFKQLNLIEAWPMRGKFDIIFCRNVLIYFNRQTQADLIQRYHDILQPKGYLMLGHSESLGQHGRQFNALGRTLFQRRQ